MQASDAIPVSEIFVSLQGEGPNAGRRALFLRLAFCNLKCVWCDSAYTWKGTVRADWMSPDTVIRVLRELWGRPAVALSVDAPDESPGVAGRGGARFRKRGLSQLQPHLVITGGEPMLFQDRLIPFLRATPGWFVEVETNGTVAPLPDFTAGVSGFNVSPKLANSRQPFSRRWNPDAFSAFLASGKAFWKFVVCSDRDLTEIRRCVEDFGFPRGRVFLVPEGNTRERLTRTAPVAADLAARLGVHFGPRLHICIWNGERAR
jgi:organic radical activating enzyme